MKQPRIESVGAVGQGFVLSIAWQDGSTSNVDVGGLINGLKGLASLRRPGAFRRVRRGEWGWSIAWPGGLDMSAATLWRMAREQAGDAMPTIAFKDWRARNDLTLDGAAKALGLSRRMIAYYDSGARMIPKTVWLATVGYEAGRRKRAA
jgi:hypothetical protein